MRHASQNNQEIDKTYLPLLVQNIFVKLHMKYFQLEDGDSLIAKDSHRSATVIRNEVLEQQFLYERSIFLKTCFGLLKAAKAFSQLILEKSKRLKGLQVYKGAIRLVTVRSHFEWMIIDILIK